MFCFLIPIALSTTWLTLEKPKSADAAFDIAYHTDNQGYEQKLITTKGAKGYFVGYKINNNGDESDIQLVKWSEHSTSTYDDITIEMSHNVDSNRFFYTEFNVSNTGYFYKKISLGVSADVAYGGNDKSNIEKLASNRGFKLYGIDANQYFSILTNEKLYPRVDHMFIGTLNAQQKSNIYKFPFFENHGDSVFRQDSSIAFSWVDREIPPGESIVFGFRAHTTTFETAPEIIDLTEKKEYYEQNEETQIKFKIFKYVLRTRQKRISITITLSNGSPIQESFTASSSNHEKEFTIPVNVGHGPEFTYTISAKDNIYNKDETISVEGTLSVSRPPDFTVVTPPKDSYAVNDRITVVTQARNAAKFKYRFDNGRIEDSAGSTYNIGFPDAIKLGKNHTLILWAENQYGVPSVKKSYNVGYGVTVITKVKKSIDYERNFNKVLAMILLSPQIDSCFDDNIFLP